MIRMLLMVSTAATALVSAQAQAAEFLSGARYTIPVTGVYDFTAIGASGGDSSGGAGGLGALIKGRATLTAGTFLGIAIGRAGQAGYGFAGGGGGSATAIYFTTPPFNGTDLNSSNLLVVAGGGGGGGVSDPFQGGNQVNPNATGMGGSGKGGAAGTLFIGGGAGGAGINGNGGDATYRNKDGRFKFARGGHGPIGGYGRASFGEVGGDGGSGGIGGGGGYIGGGGGGGFTGGNGAHATGDGGGGTSYLRDGTTLVSSGLAADRGNGRFILELESAQVSAVPEPTTWLMLLLGLGSVGMMMRRRKRADLPLTV